MRESIVTIEKMAFGGAGLGHLDGKVCFVPFTAIGDTVRISIVTDKKSYAEGKLMEILKPSPLRTVPDCPIFGTCGGCDLQHIAYDAQLKAKEEIFAEILWRTARVERTRILPIIGAPDPYGYRSRVQLKMRRANGKNHLGFFIAGSHYVVDLPERCAISCESINHTYRELKNLLDEFPETDRIPQIDVSVGDDGNVILIFHYVGENRAALLDFLLGNRHRLSKVNGVFLQSGRKAGIAKVYGVEFISYTIPADVSRSAAPINFRTSRGGFSQVNYRQNYEMIDTVLQWLQFQGTEKVLDLYCGNGNFTLPLAGFAKQVTGFEEYAQSISDAEWNRDKNSITNAFFKAVDSEEGVRKLAEARQTIDVVVLDPPRSGAAETVKLISLLGPRKIIYISCDPPTLARDIASLKKSNYKVVKSRPIDMFPQTYHIESITMLERCS